MADTIGFAGGIWLLWRSDLVQVDVLASTEQEIHALIWVRFQNFSWIISAIYASPRFVDRCLLWDNLTMLASLHNLPWALMGDFNEVLSEDEKLGGNTISQRRVRVIQDCMNSCQMMDLGYLGPKFAWSNKRDIGGLIQCRLDRCWANPEWKALFAEANVTHLARANSDHCPLLLNLNPSLGERNNRPFCFQPFWLSHTEILVLVREAWNGQDPNLPDAISVFTSKALRWNKDVFGNVFTRKKTIMARLLGVQKALTSRPNPFLINLQNKLNDEYNLILQLEEELWAMKARTNWIIHGERNIAYFHMSTLVRRSRNKVSSILNDNGEWVHNIDEVKDIFGNYFKKLYQTEQICNPPQFCLG